MSTRNTELIQTVFAAIAQSSADAIALMDRKQLLFANEAFHALYEAIHKRSLDPGVSIFTGFGEDIVHCIKRALDGEPSQMFKQIGESNAPTCYQVSFTPVFSSSSRNEVVAGLCVWRDLTAQHRAEQRCKCLLNEADAVRREAERAIKALQESEEKFRIVADNARAVFGIVQGKRFVYANPYLSELSGYTNEEILSMDIAEMIHPDSRAKVLEYAARRQAGGSAPQHYEFAMVTKAGETRWMDFSPARITYNGEPAVVGTAFDITDRKQEQELLIQSEKLASVGRMAATIAHEINNPLEAAMSALYLVKTDPSLPERVKSSLGIAEQELARVSHITKQTLGFYHEVGDPTAVDVAEVLDSVLEIYGSRLRNKNVSLQRRYRGSSAILTVEREVRQLAATLIANSIDALPQNGKLQVRLIGPKDLRESRRMIRMTIADNGNGIPAENQKRIFEPFFTTNPLGTGLGLWISSELVKKHRGRIRFRSMPGKGTVAVVWLPMERRVRSGR